MIEIIKAIILGIIEGITEWLPISSTGHMILVDEFLQLGASAAFKEMFIVVIQLGAIMAVVVLYWSKLLPFSVKGGLRWKPDVLAMWGKIIVACIPTAIYGFTLDDVLSPLLYNYVTVAVMLVLVGILFLVVENWNKNREPGTTSLAGIGWGTAFWIGMFQLVAAVLPGTSRSGITIIGGLVLGVSRAVAAEFTFFLGIPAMFGASLLKLLKFGFSFSGQELLILLVGMVVAFVVSIFAIRFLMNYIKRHDFKIFGWYRIALGVVVLAYFLLWGRQV